MYQNLWDASKGIVRENFRVLNISVRKEHKLKIHDQSIYQRSDRKDGKLVQRKLKRENKGKGGH